MWYNYTLPVMLNFSGRHMNEHHEVKKNDAL